MAETLPGTFRPVGKKAPVDTSRSDEQISRQPEVSEDFVSQYRAMKDALGLDNPTISYPASGADISLSEVFPHSITYYIDPDQGIVDTLRRAQLPNSNVIIQASAYGYHHPKPVDLLVLRNASTETNENKVSLANDLREGGYVVTSHWMSSGDAIQFLNAGFTLVGAMERLGGTKPGFSLERDRDGSMAKALGEDYPTRTTDTGIDLSKFRGKTFVFQKPITPSPVQTTQ